MEYTLTIHGILLEPMCMPLCHLYHCNNMQRTMFSVGGMTHKHNHVRVRVVTYRGSVSGASCCRCALHGRA